MTTFPPESPGSGRARPTGARTGSTSQGATSAAYTPTLEEDRGNYIRATASYTDDEGPNKTANAGIAPRGRPAPGELGARVPVHGGRAARSGGELRGRFPQSATPVAATDLNAGELGGQRPARPTR